MAIFKSNWFALCVGLHPRAPQWWETPGAAATRGVLRQGRDETHQRAWDNLPGSQICWDAAEGAAEVCSSQLPPSSHWKSATCVFFLTRPCFTAVSAGMNVSVPLRCIGSSCVLMLGFHADRRWTRAVQKRPWPRSPTRCLHRWHRCWRSSTSARRPRKRNWVSVWNYLQHSSYKRMRS